MSASIYLPVAGEGPFTLFAPSDAAFAKLADTIDIKELDDKAITFILAYHVYSGMIMAADIESGFVIALNEDGIYIEASNSGVVLNSGSNVVTTDLVGSNGVIHIIDEVLLPPVQDITEIAASNGFDILVDLLTTANLIDVLAGDGPFTIFGPSDAAFLALGENTIAALKEDIPTLTNVLLYHVTTGYLGSGELPGIGSIETLAEGGAKIMVRPNGKTLNGNTEFEMTDIIATNGVVHVVDKVLIPPSLNDPEQR
jgi:transforming growth factor-beta-induced protein